MFFFFFIPFSFFFSFLFHFLPISIFLSVNIFLILWLLFFVLPYLSYPLSQFSVYLSICLLYHLSVYVCLFVSILVYLSIFFFSLFLFFPLSLTHYFIHWCVVGRLTWRYLTWYCSLIRSCHLPARSLAPCVTLFSLASSHSPRPRLWPRVLLS